MVCSSCVCFFKLTISVNGCLFLYVTLWFKGGAWGGVNCPGCTTPPRGDCWDRLQHPLFSPLCCLPHSLLSPFVEPGGNTDPGSAGDFFLLSCWVFFSPLCSKVLLRVWFSNHQSLFQQGFCFSLSNSNTVLYVCTANRLKRRIWILILKLFSTFRPCEFDSS